MLPSLFEHVQKHLVRIESNPISAASDESQSPGHCYETALPLVPGKEHI